MEVMVFARPREMRVEDRPYPDLRDGEVIVKVEAAGICGSDLHGYLGTDATRAPGMILGHEVAGRVVETTTPAVPVGTLVSSNSARTCGVCVHCMQGRDNLCERRQSLGKHRQGAFAEYLAVPVSMLVDVPQDMDPVVGALIEPTAVALHVVNRTLRHAPRPVAEQAALVVGCGTIGLLAAVVLRRFGCRALTVAEPNVTRRHTAERLVGCVTCDPAATEIEPESFDCVIDAVGSARSLGMALAAVRRGGVIGETGLHDHDVAIDLQRLTRGEVSLLGAANYPAVELHAAARHLAEGLLDDLSWVQLRPLADGPQAFEELADGRSSFTKIVLQPARAARATAEPCRSGPEPARKVASTGTLE